MRILSEKVTQIGVEVGDQVKSHSRVANYIQESVGICKSKSCEWDGSQNIILCPLVVQEVIEVIRDVFKCMLGSWEELVYTNLPEKSINIFTCHCCCCHTALEYVDHFSCRNFKQLQFRPLPVFGFF